MRRGNVRTEDEIQAVALAGQALAQAVEEARRTVEPGVETGEIARQVLEGLRSRGAEPILMGFPHPRGGRPFPTACCISVNEQVVHGLPGSRKIAAGDVVTIDASCRLDGWCADMAVTMAVPPASPPASRLVHLGREALHFALQRMAVHDHWEPVAQDLSEWALDMGVGVVDSLLGHAVGRRLHESPQFPHIPPTSWAGPFDFALEPGLVLAVEPALTLGAPRVKLLADGWTVSTQDGSLSCHFEHTVALTNAGPKILTLVPAVE